MPVLKFGLTCGFQNPKPWLRPYADLYRINIDLLAWSEELGFDSAWVSEHHFAEDGYCPAVLPVCAALAMRTTRIAIGTKVLLLPLHDPVRVAEDSAIVDILSNGRFQLGVAGGYRVEEFEGFGINRRERGSRLDEAVEVIRRAWTEDRFSFEGRHFQYRDLKVEPRPVQRPHPPIWLGGRAEPAIRRAARLGCHFMISGVGEASHQYAAALTEYGRDPGEYERMGIVWAYVHEDPEQAWNDAKDHLLYAHNFYRQSFREAADLPTDNQPQLDDAEQLRDAHLVGTPDQVAEKIKRLHASGPFEHLVLWMQLPGLDPDRAARSIELFARQVLPRFRDR